MKFKNFELICIDKNSNQNIIMLYDNRADFLNFGKLLDFKYDEDDIAVFIIQKFSKYKVMVVNKHTVVGSMFVYDPNIDVRKENNCLYIISNNIVCVFDFDNNIKIRKEYPGKIKFEDNKFLLDEGRIKTYYVYDKKRKNIILYKKDKFINLLHLYYVYLFHNDKFKIKRQIIDFAIKKSRLFSKYNKAVESVFGKDFINKPEIEWNTILSENKVHNILLFKKALRLDNYEFYNFLSSYDIKVPKINIVNYIANNTNLYEKVKELLMNFFINNYNKYIDKQ